MDVEEWKEKQEDWVSYIKEENAGDGGWSKVIVKVGTVLWENWKDSIIENGSYNKLQR